MNGRVSARWLTGGLLAAALVGCAATAGSGPLSKAPAFGSALAVPPAIEALSHAAVRTDQRKSWMLPSAKKIKELLYVGSYTDNDVYVYDYQTQALVGTLTGFNEPLAMCVDAKGDVWVSNYGTTSIVEYSQGSTSPIQTLSTAGYPFGCSIDPIRGDLAVTSATYPYGYGAVQIWSKAKGSP